MVLVAKRWMGTIMAVVRRGGEKASCDGIELGSWDEAVIPTACHIPNNLPSPGVVVSFAIPLEPETV